MSDDNLVGIVIRVPEPHRRLLRAQLAASGSSLQEWGANAVRDHIRIQGTEIDAALEMIREGVGA